MARRNQSEINRAARIQRCELFVSGGSGVPTCSDQACSPARRKQEPSLVRINKIILMRGINNKRSTLCTRMMTHGKNCKRFYLNATGSALAAHRPKRSAYSVQRTFISTCTTNKTTTALRSCCSTVSAGTAGSCRLSPFLWRVSAIRLYAPICPATAIPNTRACRRTPRGLMWVFISFGGSCRAVKSFLCWV